MPRPKTPKARSEPADLEQATELNMDFLRIAEEEIPLKIDGAVRAVTIREALVRKQVQMALHGGTHAMRQLLERLEEAEKVEQARREENILFWAKRKQELARLYAQHTGPEEEPPAFPHPDDIELCPVNGVKIHGPLTREVYNRHLNTIDFMKALLLLHAHDVAKAGERTTWKVTADSVFTVAIMLNETLPRRMHWLDVDLAHHYETVSRRPMRVLTRDTHQAWKALGSKVKRGKVFPAKGGPKIYNTLGALTELFASNTSQQKPPSLHDIAMILSKELKGLD